MKIRKVLITASIMLFTISCVFGIIMRSKTPDSGISGISSWDELSSFEIRIMVLNDNDSIHHDELDHVHERILDDLKSADIVVMVKPTGGMLFTSYGVGQQVIVEKTIKGEVSEGEEVEIYFMNHLSLENNEILYQNWYNYMIPGKEYLVFLQKNGLNDYQKEKTFQVTTVSYSFPAYYPVDFEPEISVYLDTSAYCKNMDKILFSEDEELIKLYQFIREKAFLLVSKESCRWWNPYTSVVAS